MLLDISAYISGESLMEDLCSRCRQQRSSLRTRGENFCETCFIDFLGQKFYRAMEPLRGHPSPLVVIPVSFGIASTSLVDLTERLLQFQREKLNSHRSIRVVCVHIGERRHWPFNLEVEFIPEAEAFEGLDEWSQSDSHLTRSSRQDLRSQVLRQALVKFASSRNASAVLYSFSTTTMSQFVLTETIKGRGQQIPAIISSENTVKYPLREITQPELEKYVQVRRLRPAEDTVKIPQVTKLQSIDEIVGAYFTKTQQEFPAVVSTVSKVADKLSQDPEPCSLCRQDPGNTYCYACRITLGC